MRENADYSYDIEFEVAGVRAIIRRTLDLCKRIEGAFGAIDPLSRRLAAHGLTVRELSHLIVLIFEEAPSSEGPPTRDEIEAWLFEHGTHAISSSLANEVLTLIIGNDVLAEVVARKSRVAGKELARAPFAQTAASTGRTG